MGGGGHVDIYQVPVTKFCRDAKMPQGHMKVFGDLTGLKLMVA